MVNTSVHGDVVVQHIDDSDRRIQNFHNMGLDENGRIHGCDGELELS